MSNSQAPYLPTQSQPGLSNGNPFTQITHQNLKSLNPPLHPQNVLKQYLQNLPDKLRTTDRLSLEALHDIANTLNSTGQFTEARLIYGQLLTTCERHLGGKHPFTVSVVSALGNVYTNEALYRKALPMYERALIAYEDQLGRIHPYTLETINSIGMVHILQGRFDQALKMFKRMKDGLEKIYGNEHPATLAMVAIIGKIYSGGRYANALEFNQAALGGMDKVLGERHPVTLETMFDVAVGLQRQGRYTEAQAMMKRLKARQSALASEKQGTERGKWLLLLVICVVAGIAGIYSLRKNTGAE